MNELRRSFTNLFEDYSKVFDVCVFEGSNRAELMAMVPRRVQGVYTYWIKGSNKPFYIGCAGKISKEARLEGNTIKNRMFSATTPYHCKRP